MSSSSGPPRHPFLLSSNYIRTAYPILSLPFPSTTLSSTPPRVLTPQPRHSNIHINQHRLPHPLNLRDHTLQVEGLREHDLEYLLHVYGSRRRTEDERGVHRFREPFRLLCDLFLFVSWESGEGVEFCADEEGDGCLYRSKKRVDRRGSCHYPNGIGCKKNRTHLVEASRLSIPFLDGI